MKVELKHYGRILPNGNISFYNPELWTEQRQALAGKEFEIVIKERYKRPTVNQFGYYFGCILGVCLTCNQFSHYQTRDEIHKEVFSPLFLTYKVKVIVGKKSWMKDVTRSLTELTKNETSDFIQNVLNFCAQEGIEIPEADNYVDKFYREITIIK